MQGYFPLTQAQKRIWLTEQLYPGTSISNLSFLLKIKDPKGVRDDHLISSLHETVRFFDSLRIKITVNQDKEPYQYQGKYEKFPIKRIPVTCEQDRIRGLEWCRQEAQRPMTLYEHDLFSSAICKINEEEGWIFFKVHHIIMDGISLVMIASHILDAYEQLVARKKAEPASSPSYLEYVQSEMAYVTSGRFQKDKRFWNTTFQDIPEVARLAIKEGHRSHIKAQRFTKTIPHILHQGMKDFCAQHRISPHTFFLSLLYIYVYRMTGQTDQVIGTFLANRTNAVEKQMLGMFVSTVPIRFELRESDDFLTTAQRLHKVQAAIIRHQKYPYNFLLQDLREKQAGLNRLFAHTLEFQAVQIKEREYALEREVLFSGEEANDFSIHIKEYIDQGRLVIDIDYATELFIHEEIDRLYRCLIMLVEEAISTSAKAITEMELCPIEDRDLLLQPARRHTKDPVNELTLTDRFDQQVKKHPSQPAIMFHDRCLSYQDVHERVDQVSRYLQAQGVKADEPVAIFMERSEKIIIAILAVLKAGGAYVPLDPTAPAKRLQYIIEDAQAAMLITEEKADWLNHAEGVKTILFTEELLCCKETNLADGHGANFRNQSLLNQANPNRLAYILYTSGTTGKPKGVMIEHRQVNHLLEGMEKRIYGQYEHPLQIALLAPLHFDASVQQIFASLLYGHTLHIAPPFSLMNGSALTEFYKTHQIEITDATPAHLQLLLEAENVNGVLLKHMLVGGEALPWDSVSKWKQKCKEAGAVTPRITNVYGPTECCVDVTTYDLPSEALSPFAANGPYVPIGKGFGNNRLYILDKNRRLLPYGAVGELCIAGDSVGRGYLNLHELTAEKFVVNPFDLQERMFCTGDLARWMPDGNLEYLGRADDQVKIRGFRIELGEIEATLLHQPDVKKAVVLALLDRQGERELCAFVVPEHRENPPAIAMLRSSLAVQLPSYMIPAHFIIMDQLPVTSNGKINRQELAQQKMSLVCDKDIAMPENETERRLLLLWREVLDIEKIGIHDSFFETGGHSLKAMKLLNRLRKEWGVDVPIRVLFECPTIHFMAHYIQNQKAKGHFYNKIKSAATSDVYPLSFAQRRIYLSSQVNGESTVYNMPAMVHLKGFLDIERLEKTLNEVIKRHEVLRTSFVTRDGVPFQKIHEEASLTIARLGAAKESLNTSMAEFIKPFSLHIAPLLRAGIVSINETEHVMMFDMHHIISDGVTIQLLCNEMAKLYANEQLPEPALHYKDYVCWQEARIELLTELEGYWLERFRDEPPVLQLPTDYPRPAIQTFDGDRVTFWLNKEQKLYLQQVAEQSGTTLYIVMLAAYYVLLAKYTGQEEFIVGTPVAGRNHPDTEKIMGMFVNTVAIFAKLDSSKTFADFLKELQECVLGAFEHQDYPFEWLLEKLKVERDLSRHPLFDTMFILQSSLAELPAFPDLSLEAFETNFHIAKFDITIQVQEEQAGLRIDLDYNTNLFTNESMKRMLGHYVYLLQTLTRDSDTPISEIAMMSREEREQVLSLNSQVDPHIDQTLVSLFEEQVSKTPDQVAVQCLGASMTYREINERANQLARALIAKGAKAGTVVAMLLERCIDMVVTTVAIVKAGGIFMPLDIGFPAERITYLLADSKASLLITQRCQDFLLEQIRFSGQKLYVEDASLYEGESTNVGQEMKASDMVTITYTSGTTGLPKGNMVMHQNIIRVTHQMNYLTLDESDTVLSLSNYVFDGYLFDIFAALLNGARLVVATKEQTLDVNQLSQLIEKERISVLFMTTALFNVMVDSKLECFKNVRKVLFGGERASVEHVREAVEALGSDKLIHVYGPSESSIFATFYPVQKVSKSATFIPIGKPINDTSVYIVNAWGQLNPIGVVGELCLGGAGLVLGYWNRPELTAESFICSPIYPHNRMYRTGDLARLLPDGNIEYFGRADMQVKVRGHRIELAEIEHQIMKHEAIREAVVIAGNRTAKDTELIAYFVADRLIPSGEVREHISRQLPVYMMPTRIIQLDNIPLTGIGKVDRRALMSIKVPEREENDAYRPPISTMEKAVVQVMQEVLACEQIGMNDHFFARGGHSLKAMMFISKFAEQVGIEIPLRVIFEAENIQEIANYAERSPKCDQPRITALPQRPFYPVSSSQKRLYAISELEGGGTAYHIPIALISDLPLEHGRLEKALQQLIMRHEALRTSFHTVSGKVVQSIHHKIDFMLPWRKVTSEREIGELFSAFIQPFHLKKAPLFRAEFIQLADNRNVLFLDFHHIAADGTSLGILLHELSQLYGGEEIPAPIFGYKEYAVWQNQWLTSSDKQKQENYWMNIFANQVPLLNWKTSKERPALKSYEGDFLTNETNEELLTGLHAYCAQTGTTPFMVLLAAYIILLHQNNGQEDIIVGTPIAGRRLPEVQQMVGMFVGMLPIRSSPSDRKTCKDFLLEVKETVLQAFEHQDYPLELLVDKIGLPRDTSRSPLFDTVFALQNMELAEARLGKSTLEPYPVLNKIAKYDVTFMVREVNKRLKIDVEYSTALFEQEQIILFTEQYIRVLECMLAHPDWQLSEIGVSTGEEFSERRRAYWASQLSEDWPLLKLPTDIQSSKAEKEAVLQSTKITIKKEIAQRLVQFAKSENIPLSTLLLTAYSSWLARMTNQEDIAIAFIDYSRMDFEQSCLFPIRATPREEKAFNEFARELHHVLHQSYVHRQGLNDEWKKQALHLEEQLQRPLCNTTFIYATDDIEGYPPSKRPIISDSSVLSLMIMEAKEELSVQMNYDANRISAQTIKRWGEYFLALLEHVGLETSMEIGKLRLLSQNKQQKLLKMINNTKEDYPCEQTIPFLFEEQVKRNPERIAIVHENQHLTYRQLNERSNRLAHRLVKQGVAREGIVGISFDSSFEMIISILAVLKSGAAYLPIDPHYPEERIRYLLEDSKTTLLLTQRRLANRFEGVPLLYADDRYEAAVPTENLPNENHPTDLAYVMYTSGSTGNPKGVMIEHRNIIRLVYNTRYMPFHQNHRVVQTGSLSFDASTFEVFGSLLHGSALYLIEKEKLLDVQAFTQFLNKHSITTMFLISPLFHQFAEQNPLMFAPLQHLIVGGDVLVPHYINRVRRECPALKIWNAYGPTENTTFSTVMPIHEEYRDVIPIGKPIGNSTVYILNRSNQLQPIGVAGELYVGGDGVGRGYLHRPELTCDTFIVNPFVPSERMYRTGDLAKWLPDGNIHFLGRVDHQVKVRGYRIELGEIETRLLRVSGVREAVVIVREDTRDHPYMIAYFTAEQTITPEEMRQQLMHFLPEYMLPSYFVQLEVLPLTAHGKVDRNALPQPSVPSDLGYETEVRSEQEELLVHHWQQALGIDKVGLHDNFFTLGGDSIKAIQLTASLYQHGLKLEMKDLFQYPSIAQVAPYLQKISQTHMDQSPVEGEVLLTPIQHWFFEQQFTDEHHWNQDMLLYAKEGFDLQITKQVIQKLWEHHDALRMAFLSEAGEVIAYNYGPTMLDCQLISSPLQGDYATRVKMLSQKAAQMQASMAVAEGPLCKVGLFTSEEGDYLLFVIHHLVVDGVSWRILLEDFISGYYQAQRGEEIIFPAKTHSCQEWARNVAVYANSKAFIKEIDYWKSIEQTTVPRLPKDTEIESCTRQEELHLQFQLSKDNTQELLTKVHQAYHTEMNDILLTALGLALHAWTGEEQFLINLEGHGREEIVEGINISRTVGWFTSQYPVILPVTHASQLPSQIKQIKEHLRSIPHKGIGYGILRYVTEERNKQGLSLQLTPEISFNYLGQFQQRDGDGLFARSELFVGPNISPRSEKLFPLEIVGFIENERLHMRISYHPHMYNQQTMHVFSERFQENLLMLIKHCAEQKESQRTPSDFGDDELTIEEMDKLFQSFQ
ncbi:hypothetical protein AYJ08_10560 [Brevibacillus sp. SKDU10]|uniref:non-ribosomal peptide synthetase n=1 Tax=Brevibacillus sp. SKDU10 TaxID=1247872 RepID=UPI0007C8DC89|nr:non-ribosomal peptide synthetase [Brevibacillus sp. SKDU10]OAJ74063.1 hypothetical protein AYJ08_10560 [Brevibacillus sp. SKDU10]